MSSGPDPGRAEERFRAFLQTSSEAIWCFELEQPVPVDLPAAEQVSRMFEHAWLAECNEALARMYGYTTCDGILGARLPDFLLQDDPANVEYLIRFVESGYRLEDEESHERDRNGEPRYFLNNLVGIVENGALRRAWGTQRDITARKRESAEARRHQVEMELALAKSAELERRLTVLTAASGGLMATLERRDLTEAIVRLGVDLVHADAVAVWRRDDGAWRVEAQAGLSRAFAATERPAADSPGPPGDAVVFDDVLEAPGLEPRRDVYEAEGIRSIAMASLRIGDETSGTIVFYSRTPHFFTDVDRRTVAALANVSAAALHISSLYAARRLAADHARFLADAGSLLTSTFDVEATLGKIAGLAVPAVADWCAVHLVRDDGSIELLAAAHANPARVSAVRDLDSSYPVRPGDTTGVADVIRTGTSQLVERVDESHLAAVAADPRHLSLLRALELRSVIFVPLRRADRSIGTVTLATTPESGRRLGRGELSLAESLAARATLAIENARLYREANEANRLKDQFLATLSHELRTPLNAVLGWARMLADGVLDEKSTARALQAIQRNTQAQAQLVGDILELSRIVSGKVELTFEPVEMRSLVLEILDSLQPAFHAKSLQVETAFAGPLALTGDRSRLQQVVLNIVTNAAKFTPRGGRVSVSGHEREGFVEVTFADTGVGMAPDFLPHVFERFRQAEPSTSRVHGGLGIGLSVSQHLVELHHGSITASSPGPGQGATFVLKLPLAPPGLD